MEKKIKFFCIFLIIVAGFVGVFFVLKSKYALVTHPKGMIAQSELKLIITNVFLMLLIIVPTAFFVLIIPWKYRTQNTAAKYSPDKTYHGFKQLILWAIPSVVVAVMSVITWRATHDLDPYKPIESDIKPLTIQVIAMNWKWLFIYPEQQIASVNFVQFPEKMPIRFELAADGSPMNSFWIPELSGQIYCMTGMITPLHIMADNPGEYAGKAAEINGEGYASMTFTAKSSSQDAFNHWVEQVKSSPLKLTDESYNALIKPSIKNPIEFYSHVENDLFNKTVMKYMHHHHHHHTHATAW